MMSGPEHYQAAEDLIGAVTVPSSMNPDVRVLGDPEAAVPTLLLAIAEALLANAAATALASAVADGLPGADRQAWFKAAATLYCRDRELADTPA